MLESITKDVLENQCKIVPLFGAAYAASNKGTTIYTDLSLKKSVESSCKW